MVEKKIYSGWAYSKDEFEKRDMNYEIYKELNSKYKIKLKYIDESLEKLTDDYDVIYRCSSHSYGRTSYVILKNGPDLSDDELALIVDKGNLCFGYDLIMVKGGTNIYIDIYTD